MDLDIFSFIEPFDPEVEALISDLSNSPASSDTSDVTISSIESKPSPANENENRPDLEFFSTVAPFDPNEEALFPDLSNSPASSDMSNKTTESTSTPSNHHENSNDNQEVEILEPDPEICKVCGERAGKHNYYGGQVCPSCRAFFRRAVQSNGFEAFVCLKDKNCRINIRTRKSCQFCRFKKCLQAGMKPNWVLPEGQRRKRNSSTDISGSESISLQANPILQLTTEDAILIGQMISATQMLLMDKFSKGQAFFSQLILLAVQDRPFPYQIVQGVAQSCQQLSKKKMNGMPDFSSLSADDQTKLIASNVPLLHVFQDAGCIGDPDSGLTKGLAMAKKSGEFEAFNEVQKALESMNLSDVNPLVKYEHIYSSPWTGSYETEERHKELVYKIKSWLRHNQNDPAPDDVLLTLGFFIIALNSDFLTLRNKNKVESMQVRYLNMLRAYLSKKYNNRARATQKLAAFMPIISYTREAAEILKGRLPV